MYFLLDLRLVGVAEAPAASGVDLLVYSSHLHIMLIRTTVVVHVVHFVLHVVALGMGYQWNLSWIVFLLSSVRHMAAYSNAS